MNIDKEENINQVDSLGRNHGLWIYDGGYFAIEGCFSHGRRHGVWKHFEGDKLIWGVYYVNGRLEGESVTFLNDVVSLEHEEPNSVRQVQRFIILCQ